ncbi:hypothetical protein BC360_15460 [Ensifer sp. LC163]|nr:hypothetical protein BC360_15460 [Ensifer sp. LC163]
MAAFHLLDHFAAKPIHGAHPKTNSSHPNYVGEVKHAVGRDGCVTGLFGNNFLGALTFPSLETAPSSKNRPLPSPAGRARAQMKVNEHE